MPTPPPRSYRYTVQSGYDRDTEEKPTVGTTESRDSPARPFAATLFPALSSPSNRRTIFLSKMC